MRIMTVRQPWAWAIIHGAKDIENRTRNIAGSYRGPVAIHAGLRFDQSDEAMSSLWKLAGVNPVMQLLVGQPFGAIIGLVDLVDVHDAGDCPNPHDDVWHTGDPDIDSPICSKWAEEDTYHMVLENPRALATPIPLKGALGLRELDEEIERQVWAEVRS